MVFFTCGNCGESLKKNKVEKHYQTVCSRKPVSLTCVDCCKDFSADTYPAHTKCISEEEKYSAKGFTPRPSSNKGEVKQQKWQEIIQSVRQNHRNSLSRDEQIILDAIVKHENVPRKKNKFQNFLRSLMKNRYNAQAADKVFDKIEAESKEGDSSKQNDSGKQNVSIKEDEKENTTNPEIKENGDSIEQNNDVEKLSKKEKKEKRKREKYEVELKEIENNQFTEVQEGNDGERKKKRKNKEQNTGMETENSNTNAENEISEGIEMTKSKKLKKKHKKNKEISENGSTEDTEIAEEKKSKKKHKKDVDSADNEVPENNEVVEEKSKKKRKKDQEILADKCEEEPVTKKIKEGSGEKEETIEEETPGKGRFNWQETIIRVLESKDNKEMPLKRLRKKVLAEFEASGNGSAASEKTLAKFNKKVHHTPGVVVLKDVARLASAN